MSDQAVMIRARASTRDALREIAEQSNTSIIDALDQIVQSAREERLLKAVVLTLGEDHAHAIALETERFDAMTSADGLSADDDFSDW